MMKKRLCRMICLCSLVSIMLYACGKQQIGTNTEGDAATDVSEESTETVPQSSQQEKWDLIPMVMVNGKLYLDTGYDVTAKDRSASMDGKITSEVDGSEQPKEDDQSNFGTGYEYQYGKAEGLIEIHINDKWWVFATEEALKNNTAIVE